MSGGSMGLRHEKLRQVLADHAELFKAEDSDGQESALRRNVKAYLAELHLLLEATADMLQAIEWEDSGDCGLLDTEKAYEKFASEMKNLL